MIVENIRSLPDSPLADLVPYCCLEVLPMMFRDHKYVLTLWLLSYRSPPVHGPLNDVKRRVA